MVCKKCGKKFSRRTSINGKEINSNHRKWCFNCSPFNQHRKGITSKTLFLDKPHICQTCSKEFTEKYSEYSNGNFCSKKCAAQYSQKQIKGTKIVKCITCGKEIKVDIRASDKVCKCDNCKKSSYKLRKKYYYNNGILIKKVCKICGQEECQRKDICKKHRIFPSLIKYFGFDKSKIGTIKVYEEFERIKNMLEEDYQNQKLSIPELLIKYHHNDIRNFNKILNSIGTIKRDLSHAQNNAIIKGKPRGNCVNQYKCGWHTTWNNKQVFYRSSYELDYAKELDEKKVDYEVEKLRILYWDSEKQKQRVAIPDFYLSETNEIVEIKSSWTYDEINMKDKFKAYIEHGYKPKLILEHKEINTYRN